MILKNLTDVKQDMLEAVKTYGILYPSPRLTSQGEKLFQALLIEAINKEDVDYFANELSKYMKTHETTKNGITKLVPRNAHITLGYGEFDRYYILACCLYAIRNNKKLLVYRAQAVLNPRPESEALIGHIIDHEDLLEKLSNPFTTLDTDFVKFNSGISVEIVN